MSVFFFVNWKRYTSASKEIQFSSVVSSVYHFSFLSLIERILFCQSSHLDQIMMQTILMAYTWKIVSYHLRKVISQSSVNWEWSAVKCGIWIPYISLSFSSCSLSNYYIKLSRYSSVFTSNLSHFMTQVHENLALGLFFCPL